MNNFLSSLAICMQILLLSVHFSDAQWEHIGGPLGSDISSLMVDNTTICLGTANNGVFVSGDTGKRWLSMSNGLPANKKVNSLLKIGSSIIAVVSVSNYVLAQFYYSVYYSNDNGFNWFPANSGLPDSTALLCLGGNDKYFYIGTSNKGIYRSTDTGKNWASANVGLPTTSRINDMAVHGQYVFSVIDSHGVYRSTNNGNNWTKTDLKDSILFQKIEVCSTSVFIASKDRWMIWKSNNLGDTWFPWSVSLVQHSLSASAYPVVIFAGENAIHRSSDNGETWWYHSNNDNELIKTYNSFNYLAMLGKEVVAATAWDQVYISNNPGEIEANKVLYMNWGKVDLGLNLSATVSNLIAENGYLFASGPDGLFRSDNSGASWKHLLSCGTVSICNAHNGTLFGDDISGLAQSIDNGESWEHNTFLDSVIDSSSYRVTSSSSLGTNIIVSIPRHGLFISSYNGQHWDSINTGLPEEKIINHIAVCGTRIFVSTSNNGIFMSADTGQRWLPFNSGIDSTQKTSITGIVASDSVIYAGTCRTISNGSGFQSFSGNLYKTTLNATGWSKVNVGTSLTGVTFLASSGQYIWVTVSAIGGLYSLLISSNNGTTWSSDLRTGFPGCAVGACAVSNGYLFAGTLPDSSNDVKSMGVWRKQIGNVRVMQNPAIIEPTIHPTIAVYQNRRTIKFICKNINPSSQLKVSLYSINGKKMYLQNVLNYSKSDRDASFICNNLPAGLYLFRIASSKYATSKCIAIVK